MEFEVASIKPNTSDDPANANFPLGPGAVYVPNGGLFSATGYPLITYIAFAYKLTGGDVQTLQSELPAWAMTDHFDIQARAKGNPGKDDMRMMMRSLLADRFKFAIHYQTREVPALALVLVKPDKTGPKLRQHPGDSPCPTEAPPPASQEPQPNFDTPDGLPPLCGGIFAMPGTQPSNLRAAARNVPMSLIAMTFSAAANLGRPVVDHTGLTGTFDFSLEWARDAGAPAAASQDPAPDPSGPGFEQALKEQMGLKLESTKSPIEFMVIDHVEKPSGN
jgi:uncharacterized protein (TIGR03435 family)